MKSWTPAFGNGDPSPETGKLQQPNPRWNAQNFGLMGPQILANGWPIFPQKYDTKKRQPGTPRGGNTIQYKTVYKLDQQLPSAELVEYWAGSNGVEYLNVAAVMGDGIEGDFGIFAIDADIHDPAKIGVIRDIANEVFGHTPFRRGRASVSKEGWFYRRPIGALKVPTRWVFESMFDGKDEAIEVIDGGKPITISGFHHETGEFFLWPERSPYNSSPSHAPVGNEDLFLEFISRVHALYPIKKFGQLLAGKGIAAEIDYLDTDILDLRVPAIAEDKVPASQLIAGRRQDWLLPRSVPWARLNAGVVAPVSNGRRQVSGTGVSQVARAMAREAVEYTNLTESQAYTRSLELIRSAAVKIVDGSFKPLGTQRKIETLGGPVIVSKARLYPTCNDAELAWLPRVKDRATNKSGGVGLKGLSLSPSDAELAAARALIPDRSSIRSRVSRQVRRTIHAWLKCVSRWDPQCGKQPPRLLIKAPTGAGKTTALLQELVSLKKHGFLLGPILMLLPSYENAAELEARLDLGVWTKAQENRANEIKNELNALGGDLIKVMTFKGKIPAGCLEEEKVRLLQSKRISTAGLCHTQRKPKEGNETEAEQADENGNVHFFCKYNPENPNFDDAVTPCEAILQKLRVPAHDLILAPHAFIQTNIPNALKECVAVVIDEKIWDKTLGSYDFPLEETLRHLRAQPEQSKAEERSGINTLEYVDHRGFLADVVIPAIRGGKDVSKVVLDHEHVARPARIFVGEDGRQHIIRPGVVITGETLLAHAKMVSGRSQRIVLDVQPGISMPELMEICHYGLSEWIVEEHKLWTIIEERMNALQRDRMAELQYKVLTELFDDTKPTNGPDERVRPKKPVPEAKQSRDTRIIYLAGAEDRVTVAWRKKRNFQRHPTLFLDASGRKEILEKIWGGMINAVTIKAPLHVRTVLVPDFGQSKTSILPSQDDSTETLLRKAELQTLDREAIYTLGLMHGDSALVACAAKDVRVQLNSKWSATANAHFMHFGAVRGLDFAKHHGAAVSIGSVTARDIDIDAYVAALSYDDDEPEALNDPHGNGKVSSDPASANIERWYVARQYPLRDGGTALVEGIHEYAGSWARMLQQQIREEELAQFVGRLRPVYREGEAPTWYVLGKILPEGIIVDDIISLRDFARPIGRSIRVLRTVKARGGVITEMGHGLFSMHLPHSTDVAAGKLAKEMISNPRLARSFHEISYNIPGDAEGVIHLAWVSAAECDAGQALGRFVEVFEGGLSDADREDAGRPVFKGKPRLSRAVRMQSFGRPTKQHEIDVVLGTLEERARQEALRGKDLETRDMYGRLRFDEKRLGFVVGKYCYDQDTYATYRGFKAAIDQGAKECEETEAKSKPRPVDPVNTFDEMVQKAFGKPPKVPENQTSLPFQVHFGKSTAVTAETAHASGAATNENVVPFPRRLGHRPRLQP